MNMSASMWDTKAVDCHIGSRIREERIKRGMSQAELAHRIGITYQQAHKYERGINRTAASRLVQIAAILDIEVSDLLPTAEAASSPARFSRQELELARNFVRIRSERQRDSVCDLVRALAAE